MSPSSTRARLRPWWNRLMLYLPVGLMGLLASVSYWLVRTAPDLPILPLDRPQRSEPDYYLVGFSVRSFDALGRLQSEMQGQKARHFPMDDRLDIESVQLRATDAQGLSSHASADRAIARANGEHTHLLGNAVLVRERAGGTPLEIRSEDLEIWAKAERLRANRPVRLQQGTDRFEADQLHYDHNTRILELSGRVRGVIYPPPTRATGSGKPQ